MRDRTSGRADCPTSSAVMKNTNSVLSGISLRARSILESHVTARRRIFCWAELNDRISSDMSESKESVELLKEVADGCREAKKGRGDS